VCEVARAVLAPHLERRRLVHEPQEAPLRTRHGHVRLIERGDHLRRIATDDIRIDGIVISRITGWSDIEHAIDAMPVRNACL
jgi:hypothetical protein